MTDENKRSDKPPTASKSWYWLLLPAVGLGIGGLLLLLQPSKPPEPLETGTSTSHQAITAAEARELTEQHNLGLALLENEAFEDAATVYGKLNEKLPTELLVTRNLAICHLMAISSIRAETKESQASDQEKTRLVNEAVQRAKTTANDLLQLEPKSAIAHWIAAKACYEAVPMPFDLASAPAEEVIDHFKQGMECDPANVAVRHAIVSLVSNSAGIDLSPELSALRLQAAKEAFAAAPRNVVLGRSCLLVQLDEADDALLDTLQTLKPLVEPILASQMKNAHGPMVMELITSAEEALATDNVTGATRALRGVGNLLNQAWILRNDSRICDPNPLEFVITTFSDEFRSKYTSMDSPIASELNVHFEPFAEVWQVPQVSDVRDARLVDFDLDQHLDLALLESNAISIYRRNDQGDGWENLGGIDLTHDFSRLIEADLYLTDATSPDSPKRKAELDKQHDTLMGLIAFGPGGIRIFRNELDKPDQEAILAEQEHSEAMLALTEVTSVLPIDIEHDGDLDLIISSAEGITLWSNHGTRVAFEEITQFSVLPDPALTFDSLTAVDWDRDVDVDILLAGATAGAAGYLENLDHAHFVWRPFPDDFSAVANATSLSILDNDGNVSWDIVAAGAKGLHQSQTISLAGHMINHMTSQSISSHSLRGAKTIDIDNDGIQDLVAWSAEGLHLHRGNSAGGFTEFSHVTNASADIENIDIGDIDGDGDLDILTTATGTVSLLKNEGGNNNRWVALNLRGIDDNQVGRMNHYGIGTLAEMKVGSNYQPQVISRRTTHFGIGSGEQSTMLRLLLTTGIPQQIINPEQNITIHEKMRQKGSCPYVYTWDGERFAFHTDLLWAAPLGLQIAAGEVLPGRPWEYLLIPGEKLKPRDGLYEIRVTEELWEAAYFDEIKLIAIDHPAEVDVFSNEKVGPADMAAFQIHTVTQRQSLQSAVNQSGRDVSTLIASRDGKFLKAFDAQFRKGLTEDHYIELHLGELQDPTSVKLFMTGWLNPTDTSLNVSISQNPALPSLHGPSLSVPDAEGQWQTVRPFIGFPGGKTKTIVIDLSDAFLTDDFRVRIATNRELYWDEIFYTVDDAVGTFHQTNLELNSAELRYRGYSRMLDRKNHGPEGYDYNDVDTRVFWPPMAGRFTRFGDVRKLLTDTDDLMAILGAGDEMAIAFRVPPEDLPPGWQRDFIMHNVGWDKDADLNTIHGQSVEPLPFHSMRHYPYEPDQTFPDSPAHLNYLQEYQTRRQPWSEFWRQWQRN